MRVKVRLESAATPVVFEDAFGAYVKAGFYCVSLPSGEVVKFPMARVFQVVEDYGYHAPGQGPVDV